MQNGFEKLLRDEKYFSSLIHDINQSTISIMLETYIFLIDEVGEKIFEALCAAAKRGVKVRVLIDGVGSRNWDNQLTHKLQQSGGHLKIYHPLPWMFHQWKIGAHLGLSRLTTFFHLIANINSRNHRKVCIIDHKIIYIGGANITAYPDHNKNNKWQDITIKYQGNTAELEHAFDVAWGDLPLKSRFYYTFISKDSSIFRLNYTLRRKFAMYKQLLHQMKKCKNRIWIVNPYFVPNHFFLNKLRKSAKKGIDVCIVIPKNSDLKYATFLSRSFYLYLLNAGITILEHSSNKILHTKALIIDDWMCIGSSNVNYRSFRHDLEADIILQDSNVKKELEQYIGKIFSESEMVLKKDVGERSLWERILGKLLFVVRYWF